MRQTVQLLFIAAAFSLCSDSLGNSNPASYFFQNTIVVTVDAKGKAMIGKDSFDMEGLSHELQQRFWKSYLGTGKMQQAVKLEFIGKVPSTFRNDAVAAIKKGQQDALVDLCLQLHKKRFEDLSARQQEKIKTKYPILFQQNFTE